MALHAKVSVVQQLDPAQASHKSVLVLPSLPALRTDGAAALKIQVPLGKESHI